MPNWCSPSLSINITHFNEFTKLRKRKRKWDSYKEEGRGGGGGGRGNSDRIHGPTDEYNDRTQYVIDYGSVAMYLRLYINVALFVTLSTLVSIAVTRAEGYILYNVRSKFKSLSLLML